MSDKKKILVQIDPDRHASLFDRVVAVDAGAEEIVAYAGVGPSEVTPLVHGAIFTRGPADLKHTAIFIGGSNVSQGEALLSAVRKAFFGPMRVSVMLDANGANTTAAAAVLAAGKHLDLAKTHALVLGGTGPVGQRAALLLAREGARVKIGSRSKAKAGELAGQLDEHLGGAPIIGVGTSNANDLAHALEGVELVIGAGAAGAMLLPEAARKQAAGIRVLIDLNAVPPAGIEGVDLMDKATDRDGVTCYGAIGVGGTKMKVHKAAIRALFESNDKVLDAEEIYGIAKQMG